MLRSFAALLLAALAVAFAVRAEVNPDITSQIQAKQQKLLELRQSITTYQSAIAKRQAEALTLKKQLGVLDDKISEAQLSLQANELNLSTVTLQIQSVTLDLAAKQEDIQEQRRQISQVIRELYQADQQSLIEVLVLNPTLGRYFEQLAYLGGLQRSLQERMNEVTRLKQELEHKQQELASYRTQLVKAREQLEASRANLQVEQDEKQNILRSTRQSESRYQSLLQDLRAEQERANRDISLLEATLRRRLQQPGFGGLARLGEATLIWPVPPNRGISTYFHDPTYIFRRYFEHPGVDIPRSQGSDIAAAADGYVGRAKDAGLGYSYIMLIHRDGFATVYGHVSRLDVAEGQYVAKGQVIGGVGGLPGTRGSGPLTTGAHLHFEVRLNGLPVNPLEYLP